mmetsp:Transcript_16934/g.46860  ORF Transcript_16934/g.46860 Transcript_16934/m.46860 type:complete len:268 (-) Transcript_16934:904-1707(-)
MGGDDLGSDDEFWAAPVIAGESSGESDDEGKVDEPQQQGGSKRKRKRDVDPTVATEERKKSQNSATIAPSESKKAKQIWMKQAREMKEGSCEEQASFLTKLTGAKVHSHCTVGAPKSDVYGSTFFDRMQNIISKKKMKSWKTKGSPMILIVCLSARRAVDLLKELAPYRLRVAKLFAKHLSVKEQENMLSDAAYPIAIGTPHRLATLADSGHLSFAESKLVVLDAFVNPKNFTVCSLPDTTPYIKDLIKNHVMPEWKERRDLKVAFV